jgi:hypothetical protein
MHAFLVLMVGGVGGWLVASVLLGILGTETRRRR